MAKGSYTPLGLVPSWWGLLAIPASVLVAFGFAAVGMGITSYLKHWQTYVVAIGLGLFGILIAYLIAKAIRVHPANARTIALETGIQNGPLAVAIILVTFRGNANIDQILLVPALYSLFIVIISTFVTFWFRRANIAQEQKIPNLL
jgi:predicted Na+-dependent transporter